MSPDTATGRVAALGSTEFDNLPDEAIRHAKRQILDTIGQMILGSSVLGGPSIVASYVAELGGTPESSVVGRTTMTSAPLAALANGTQAHFHDFDDMSDTWPGHPSCSVLASTLALGERIDCSGRDLLTAYVVGWEAGARIGPALDPLTRHGWHTVGVLGTMGATSACAALVGLDEPTTRRALGIAGSLAAGLKGASGSDTKSLHGGASAYNGVIACDLARDGLTASSVVLDDGAGFGPAFAAGTYDHERVSGGTGAWDIVHPGPAIKLHACTILLHKSIDAALEIRRRHLPAPHEIVDIECHGPSALDGPLFIASPARGLEAKFSLHYAVAAALFDGETGVAAFTDSAVERPEVRALMRRVRITPQSCGEASLLETQQRVVVTLAAGATYDQVCTQYRGSSGNPATREELVAKFRSCAGTALASPIVERVLAMIDSLDDLGQIRDLTRELRIGGQR